MPEVTETESAGIDKLVEDFTRAVELSEQYLPIVSEFTEHKSCTVCLSNAILELLRTEQEVNTENILREYAREANLNIG